MKSRKVSGILMSVILAAGLFALLFEMQESEAFAIKRIAIHVKYDSNKPVEATCTIYTDASGVETLQTNKGGVAKTLTVKEATVATVFCTSADGLKNGGVVSPLKESGPTSITVIVFLI